MKNRRGLVNHEGQEERKLARQLWKVADEFRPGKAGGWRADSMSFSRTVSVRIGRRRWIVQASTGCVGDASAPRGAGSLASVAIWPLRDGPRAREQLLQSPWYRTVSSELKSGGYRESWDSTKSYVHFFRFDRSIPTALRERKRIDRLLDQNAEHVSELRPARQR